MSPQLFFEIIYYQLHPDVPRRLCSTALWSNKISILGLLSKTEQGLDVYIIGLGV